MDFKIILTTFSMIFLAELGDKTQLAILSFAVKTKSPLSVLIGAGGALLLATLLAVVFGGVLLKFLPENYIRYFSGGLFVLFGGLILLGRW
jgi:putative Ca2+/H+ antiporter (TMEM165/GDT1 family)